MANKGRHTNGSQFYITLQPANWMDTKYVAFGYVYRLNNQVSDGSLLFSLGYVKLSLAYACLPIDRVNHGMVISVNQSTYLGHRLFSEKLLLYLHFAFMILISGVCYYFDPRSQLLGQGYGRFALDFLVQAISSFVIYKHTFIPVLCTNIFLVRDGV